MSEIKTEKTTQPALNISPEEMAGYRATAQKRWAAEQRALAQRQRRAWTLARKAADLLKTQFGATRVVLFGSLAHGHWFSQTSDIDLAVWGVNAADYLHILGRLQDLSSEFKIDLVDINHCNPGLKEAVEQEGLSL